MRRQRETVSQATAPEPESLRWWQTLHDPQLNRLVEQAVAYNPDIEIALTRVQAVRTQETVVISSALPSAEASGAAGQGTGTDLTKGRASPALRSATNNAGLSKITQLGGFDASWELDLWGRYRRQLEAVRDDAQALAEMRNAVLITVISDVVRNYTNLRGLQLRLQITRKAEKSAQKTVAIAQARASGGITNELDLTLAKRELAVVQARVPVLIGAIAHAESQIALLVGTFSSDVEPGLRAYRGLPRVPSRLRPGAPAELLRRRPDIRQAERQLASATARIGVATANLFPTVALVGAEGLQGGELVDPAQTHCHQCLVLRPRRLLASCLTSDGSTRSLMFKNWQLTKPSSITSGPSSCPSKRSATPSSNTGRSSNSCGNSPWLRSKASGR